MHEMATSLCSLLVVLAFTRCILKDAQLSRGIEEANNRSPRSVYQFRFTLVR